MGGGEEKKRETGIGKEGEEAGKKRKTGIGKEGDRDWKRGKWGLEKREKRPDIVQLTV
mgnify:FL=1